MTIFRTTVLAAVALLGSAGVAHAGKSLPDTTFGVEWEFLNNWDVETADPKRMVTDVLTDKGILCTVETTPGLNGKQLPLLMLSHDGYREGYNVRPNQAVLEVVTGPLMLGDDRWLLIEAHLNTLGRIMGGVEKTCSAWRIDGKSCFVSAAELMGRLNAVMKNAWQPCGDHVDLQSVGLHSSWPFTMEYRQKLDGSNTMPARISTQVSFVMDMESVTCKHFGALYRDTGKTAFHEALVGTVGAHKGLSGAAKALLIWATYAAHNGELIDPKNDAQHSQVKNRWAVFPKAMVHTLAALHASDAAEVRKVLQVPEAVTELCALDKSSKTRCTNTFNSADLLAADPFDLPSAANMIAPSAVDGHTLMVVEAREVMSALVKAFGIAWNDLDRPFLLKLDTDAIRDLLRDANVLSSSKGCQII